MPFFTGAHRFKLTLSQCHLTIQKRTLDLQDARRLCKFVPTNDECKMHVDSVNLYQQMMNVNNG